ncbi:uncharacterized protein V6R79_003391 [Siganus canaliculatus]
MAANTSILLLITLWASMQGGLGLPVMKEVDVDLDLDVDVDVDVDLEAPDRVTTHRVRTKRCACSSRLDTECHYFCHLDIIWVNTPSKTTLYGLGSPLSRRKRSTSRCTCANPDDQNCTNFCHQRPELISPKRSVKERQLGILNILRAVASRSRQALDSDKAERKNTR